MSTSENELQVGPGFLAAAYGPHVVTGVLGDFRVEIDLAGQTQVYILQILGDGGRYGWNACRKATYEGYVLAAEDFHFYPGTWTTGPGDAVQGSDPFFPDATLHNGTAYLTAKLPRGVAKDASLENPPNAFEGVFECQKVMLYELDGGGAVVEVGPVYSLNPVDLFLDAVINKGKKPLTRINWTAHLAARPWYAFVLPDGFPRFELAFAYNSPTDMDTLLDRICYLSCSDYQDAFNSDTGRCELFIMPPVREFRETVHTLELSNTSPDSFKFWRDDRREKANQLTFVRRDAADVDLVEAEPLVIDRRTDLAEVVRNPNPDGINLGTCRAGQAARTGGYYARRDIDLDHNMVIQDSGGFCFHALPADLMLVNEPTTEWADAEFIVVQMDFLDDGSDRALVQLREYPIDALWSDTDTAAIQSSLHVPPPSRYVPPDAVLEVTLTPYYTTQMDGTPVMGLRGEVLFASYLGEGKREGQRGRINWKKPGAGEVFQEYGAPLTPNPDNGRAAFDFGVVQPGVHTVAIPVFNLAGIQQTGVVVEYTVDVVEPDLFPFDYPRATVVYDDFGTGQRRWFWQPPRFHADQVDHYELYAFLDNLVAVADPFTPNTPTERGPYTGDNPTGFRANVSALATLKLILPSGHVNFDPVNIYIRSVGVDGSTSLWAGFYVNTLGLLETGPPTVESGVGAENAHISNPYVVTLHLTHPDDNLNITATRVQIRAVGDAWPLDSEINDGQLVFYGAPDDVVIPWNATFGNDVEVRVRVEGETVSTWSETISHTFPAVAADDSESYKGNSAPTGAQFGYLAGVTSAIQTQLNSKLASANNLSDLASAATARANLGVAIGVNVQAYDATLASLAALGTGADKIAYTTGVDVWAETPLTAFGRSLIDDASAVVARATLGVVIGVDVQAHDATLDALAAYNANGILVQTAADTFAARTLTGTANQVIVTNGSGGAGNPTLSLPQDIHAGANPTFAGLTLTANVASSLIPNATDTYDLGSATKLWRKGWLSELDAVLFAQNTISLIGGWLRLSKNEGVLPVDVTAIATTVNFGQAMTVNDFVEFRAAGAVEYVQVGSLVSGTTYNVTRDLDGSGANAWPAGSVYSVNGNTGNGRIDLNSNATPRISMVTQGATYSAQTEVLRIGDLNGNWGIAAETYGFAAGQYNVAGKSWFSVDPTNGVRLGNQAAERISLTAAGVLTIRDSAGSAVITLDAAAGAEITKKLAMSGPNSVIAIGAAPPTSPAVGTGIWLDRTGMYGLAADVLQAKFDAVTGAITAGGGNVLLDANGITISSGIGTTNKINWKSGGNLGGFINQAFGVTHDAISIGSISYTASHNARATISAKNDVGFATVIDVNTAGSTYSGGANKSYITMYGDVAAGTTFNGLFIGGNAAPAAMLEVYLSDGVTNAITDLQILRHDTSGVAAANFGASLLFRLQSSTTVDMDAGRIGAIWTTATHATRTSAVVIQAVNSAAALAEVARFAPGGLGIGVSPAYRLDVLETGNNTFAARLVQNNASASNGLYIVTQTTAAGDVALNVVSNAGANTVLRAQNNGNVGIACAPSYPLDVNGNAHAAAFVTSSDRRFKEKIEVLTGVVPKIRRLKASGGLVSHEWNELISNTRGGYKRGVRTAGVIGQEVEKEFPEAISRWDFKDDKGKSILADAIGVEYGALMPYALAGIAENADALDAHAVEVDALQKRVIALEAEVEKLKKGK